ncbi:MAG: ATP-binding cassette domain-containing protein [Saprospiraceae bacterium]|nr:ATP-binding cassette domain-containing protein [Saprospiraceae bacterium]
MANLVISAKKLILKHGNVLVLNDLYIDVQERDWVEVIGASASGKSTLIKLFYGMKQDLVGTISVLDFSLNPVTRDFQSARRRMGCVSEWIPLLPDKTVRANLAIALNAADKIKDLNTAQVIEDILSKFNLQDKSGELAEQLSSSERLLVQLCRALVIRPRLLLLDGLFDQLDENLIQLTKNEIQQIALKDPLTVVSTGIYLKPYSPEHKRVFSLELGKLKEIKPS